VRPALAVPAVMSTALKGRTHMAAPTNAANVKNILANSEPSTIWETIEGQNPSLFALEADERGYSRIGNPQH
jgi:hypothetical protein